MPPKIPLVKWLRLEHFGEAEMEGICNTPVPARESSQRPPPLCLGFLRRRCQMLYQRQFGSRMQLPKVYLIHEGADEEDAAAGAAQEVLRCKWIGKGIRIEAFALIGDDKHDVGA